MITSFRELIVYRNAYEIALELHKLTIKLPKHELFELGGQLRRASKSVAMNIAEGYGRNDSLESFKYFLTIARGSCEEVRVQLDFCHDLGYISPDQHAKYESYESIYVEIGKMLTSMIQKWKKFDKSDDNNPV